MLNQSRSWGRTWTVALAFAATSVACPAAGRAAQPGYAALSPNMAQAFSAFMEKPTSDNLQAVRGLLVAERAYNPYSADLTQLKNLLREGKNQDVIALLAKSQPNLLLSPRAHNFASEAAKRTGDENLAATEMVSATRCVDGILATGDGSPSRPFQIARMSDEADLLSAKFATQIDSQRLVFRDDQHYDRVLGKDGRTYWFDVSMLMDRAKAAEVELRVAMVPGGPAAPAAEAVPAGTAVPSTQGVPASRDSLAGTTALVQRGLDAYRQGRNDEAVTALSEAIALDPRNAGIHVDRGNVWYVKQEYERAITDFSEAIHLDPSCATAYCNRALALNTLGGQDEAITDFN
ncbi:MAG: tetratricopeptide repeat protein, partial [Thermoguttaceae bacterium]